MKKVPNFSMDEIDVLAISQIYVELDGKNLRFRRTMNLKTLDVIYHKCFKTILSRGVFEELEEEVTEDEFNEMRKKDHRYIDKKRLVYKDGGLKWEVDEYYGLKLVTLEVELDDINQEITIPKLIDGDVIIEVTGEKKFSNYSLSSKGDEIDFAESK